MKSYFLIPTCLVLAFSCKKDPPVVPEPTLSLAAVDASCIEAWLRVTTTETPATVRLLRDGTRTSDFRLLTSDTLLIDEGLLPRRTYTYQLHKLAAGSASGGDSTVIETSASVRVTTMDTTSSNWSFTIDTLGVTASVLYDVAIISDTNIWAVGQLFLRDSSGNLDPILYNAARWNGTRWDIIRIPYIYQGQTLYGALRAVFAFDANDVWLGSGNMIHWNGQSFSSVELPAGAWGPYRINKIWGHDGEIWIVGDGGSIAHRSAAGTWRQLESGTGLSVYDVFGSRNAVSGAIEVLAVASNVFQNQGAKLLRIINTGVVEMPTTGLTWGVNALWFLAGKRYYVVGPGIHQKRTLQDSLWSRYPPGQVTSYFSYAVAGIDVNDLFVAGSFREVVHFNGVSWRRYQSLMPGTAGWFGRLALRGNLAVLVGSQSPRALVAIGRRN